MNTPHRLDCAACGAPYSEQLRRTHPQYCHQCQPGLPPLSGVIPFIGDVSASPVESRRPSWQLDRCVGALIGSAVGDALGAGYEFGTPPTGTAAMIGGGLGNFAPGEWTDDTSMAIGIATVVAEGYDVREREGQARVADQWLTWQRSGPPDIGIQTSRVLSHTKATGLLALQQIRHEARELHQRTGRTAGNGALMRTAPVALAYLGDDAAIAQAARGLSEITHPDPLSGDACVLWSIAIDRAIRLGRLDGIHDALPLLPHPRRAQWTQWLHDAETEPLSSFRPNGFVVTALQAAYGAIAQTPIPHYDPQRAVFPSDHLQHALDAVIKIGDDTDTTAAIAGAVLGARWGSSGIPEDWKAAVHGWPGLRARDLTTLAINITDPASRASDAWPTSDEVSYRVAPILATPLPADRGVYIGSASNLTELPSQITAVVSLCRVGQREIVKASHHHQVWLVDSPDPNMNPNLEATLTDTVKLIAKLRSEGHIVFMHCAAGISRTGMIATAYSCELNKTSYSAVVAQLREAYPKAMPNPYFQRILNRRYDTKSPAQTDPALKHKTQLPVG